MVECKEYLIGTEFRVTNPFLADPKRGDILEWADDSPRHSNERSFYLRSESGKKYFISTDHLELISTSQMTISELESKLAECDKQHAELKQEIERMKKWEPWKPDERSWYKYISYEGSVINASNHGHETQKIIEFGNAFPSNSFQAERRAKFLKAFNYAMNVAEEIGMGRDANDFFYTAMHDSDRWTAYEQSCFGGWGIPFIFPVHEKCKLFLDRVGEERLDIIFPFARK